ncbi:LytTR family DNA-binding domain-containing protein [Hymenobacter sp. 5516J-16]|uniref:LytTR family DNA-binding domain-containing protein n=1 Tax=Hymenobacter sublimis TaxID=2933777 RepID=A0ABY4JC13_9BACT|nr:MULTISPECIES: LytTR family DNA-binding domain-containing protein [Hymenobacter]UOQ76472.1 LytTR family DNA-binding domain-containing protein [Hymenobacter sp. 5516J-16]UPL50145.1 LytTR family DNA-binding domain-containing protein [Hymenobacter sublimis]
MNALLVDDSRLARTELRHLLQAFPEVSIVGEARHAEEARQQLRELQPDLLFLDIHMPGETGFELLASLEAAPHVIFTTAYDEYALRAFEVNALDYLLKPIQENRLAAALAKARSKYTAMVPAGGSAPAEEPAPTPLTEQDQVFVKEGERCWFVRLADIRLFEINGSYTQIYFEQHRPLIPRTLQHLEQRLDPRVFFRANRQQIINLQWVEAIEPWFSNSLKIRLRGGPEVEVSRQQSVRFREMLSL